MQTFIAGFVVERMGDSEGVQALPSNPVLSSRKRRLPAGPRTSRWVKDPPFAAAFVSELPDDDPAVHVGDDEVVEGRADHEILPRLVEGPGGGSPLEGRELLVGPADHEPVSIGDAAGGGGRRDRLGLGDVDVVRSGPGLVDRDLMVRKRISKVTLPPGAMTTAWGRTLSYAWMDRSWVAGGRKSVPTLPGARPKRIVAWSAAPEVSSPSWTGDTSDG